MSMSVDKTVNNYVISCILRKYPLRLNHNYCANIEEKTTHLVRFLNFFINHVFTSQQDRTTTMHDTYKE